MNIILLYTSEFWGVDTIVAICAIVVSIAALVLSALYNRESIEITKDHNKRSMRPALKFERTFDDKNFIIKNGLLNAGPGPAFVTKLLFIYNGKKYNSLSYLLSQQIKVFHSLVHQNDNVESTFDSREVIASSDYQNIYETSLIVNKHMFEIKRVLRSTEIYVKYESIYNEKFIMREFIHTSLKIVQ